jgi:hypothetical protein
VREVSLLLHSSFCARHWMHWMVRLRPMPDWGLCSSRAHVCALNVGFCASLPAHPHATQAGG